MIKNKVILPQKVIEFIESQKSNTQNRNGILVSKHYKHAFNLETGYDEAHKWITDHFDTFLDALVNGYESEEEQQHYYIIEFPQVDVEHSYPWVGRVNGEGKIVNLVDDKTRAQLMTEQEIEKLDKRYIPFAVPVKAPVKRYYIELPSVLTGRPWVGDVNSGYITEMVDHIDKARAFTEEEIKELDERYMSFAIPMEVRYEF